MKKSDVLESDLLETKFSETKAARLLHCCNTKITEQIVIYILLSILVFLRK
jgi:hypothetical protein